MQARAGRLNNYHRMKHEITGSKAGRPAPAWKQSNIPSGSGQGLNGVRAGTIPETGSKILVGNLPNDVGTAEVVVCTYPIC